MALELRGRLVLRRRGAENAATSLRRRRCSRREAADAGVVLLHRHATAVRRRRERSERAVHPAPGEGTKQALTRGAGGLVHAPAASPRRASVSGEVAGGFGGEEARGLEQRGVHGEEMPALRRGEDAAVEDGSDGAEDAVQCVRREVQVR